MTHSISLLSGDGAVTAACGCCIVRGPGDGRSIRFDYCDMHKAARTLLRAASKLCSWIRHTVPQWTPEVDKYLEQTEDAIREADGK